jgi:hypothetical protein
MKSAQPGTTRYPAASHWWTHEPAVRRRYPRWREIPVFDPEFDATGPVRSRSWSWGRAIVALFSAAWFVITLPFRLVYGIIAWLGRMTGVILGFVLMVLGMAFLAGPLFIIGIPLFVIGLVLTLRCLE